MLKIFKITFDFWEAKIEIDTVKAEAVIKEMVEFWTGWEHRLYLNDGDYIKTFLENLAQVIIRDSIEWNLQGVRRAFENREGWCKMDGTEGIKIIYIDRWTFDEDDFLITEI